MPICDQTAWTHVITLPTRVSRLAGSRSAEKVNMSAGNSAGQAACNSGAFNASMMVVFSTREKLCGRCAIISPTALNHFGRTDGDTGESKLATALIKWWAITSGSTGSVKISTHVEKSDKFTAFENSMKRQSRPSGAKSGDDPTSSMRDTRRESKEM